MGHFMFELTEAENAEVVTNCDDLKALKYSPPAPYAFTEQGVDSSFLLVIWISYQYPSFV